MYCMVWHPNRVQDRIDERLNTLNYIKEEDKERLMLASILMMPGRKDLLCAQGADGGRLRRPQYGGSLVEAASSGAPGKHNIRHVNSVMAYLQQM
jgi:hypothetical protein